jgi:hypothetical protein
MARKHSAIINEPKPRGARQRQGGRGQGPVARGAAMKRLSQSAINRIQSLATACVAANKDSLTKEGGAKTRWKKDISTAFKISQNPKLLLEFLNDFKAQRFDKYGVRTSITIACELAALHLEHSLGPLDMEPLEPVCKYAAKLLRGTGGNSWRYSRDRHGYRDAQIASLLIMLERWGLPLFPARETRAKEQTYACDVVVKAFKDGADINITWTTVQGVWQRQSRLPEIQNFRKQEIV